MSSSASLKRARPEPFLASDGAPRAKRVSKPSYTVEVQRVLIRKKKTTYEASRPSPALRRLTIPGVLQSDAARGLRLSARRLPQRKDAMPQRLFARWEAVLCRFYFFFF
jgi:hypothetical protein